MLQPSAEQIVQSLHVFVALTILFGLRLFRFRIRNCCLLALVFALVKEFVYDILVEADTWLGSLWDFAWYMVGIVLGMITMVLGRRRDGGPKRERGEVLGFLCFAFMLPVKVLYAWLAEMFVGDKDNK